MIENIELLAFLRDNISFCRTLVIKYEDLAKLDNQLIKRFYKVDPGTDKSQWRYYMNLNGEYHFSDSPMTVKSLDDGTIIDFTKENLENHPATKNAYRLGGYYYARLVDQYPHQRDLINGIINPIPKDEAIAARDFKILRYTTEYVLWNEIQLIPELQKWIDNLTYQIFSTEYKYTDNLMYGALLAHLHESLIKQVGVLRLEARNSRYAHSFFIWSKLESEGISPVYKTLLNEKQTMWLFRNIDYVLRNLGQETTFNELMDVLLTERDIPLSKYDMVYDTVNMPDELTPEAKYLTRRLNMTERLGLAESLREISLTMLKEIPDAIDNDVMYEKMLPVTSDETNYGEQSNYPIKILESEMTDTTNRQPETFFHVLNSELIYLAKHDLYDIQIDFTEQMTGNQHMLNVSECIVVWHYLLNRYLGFECDKIPEFQYNKALKITPPTVKELMSLSGHPFLEEDWCTDLYKSHIPQYRVISPTAFHNNAKAIFDLKWDHKKMAARFPSIGYYSRRSNATSDMYETGFARLTEFKTYSELLKKYSLDFEHYTKEDCLGMMWEIWQKMTGWDQFNHQTIAQVQTGMISLMKFLSSYSLQFIKQVEVQTGWFQGGLELLTENPMLLRKDGPMPELESELDTNRIPVHLRIVTHNELDMSFVGIIEEAGFSLNAETDISARIYETPKLYPVEDQESVIELTGGHMELLRETTNVPWDLDDLIPKGAGSPQFTNGLIVDTFIGESQVGPWRAVGVEIVDNGLDNDIVTYNVGGIPVDQYAEFYEAPDLSTSGANSPKSIGASYVDNKAHYDVGFVPGRVGESVVKFDLIAEHEDTGERIKIRFQYDVTVEQHTWMNTLEIPESVILNSEFPITPTVTGLDLTGGDLKGLTYKLANGLDEWITLRQDASGELFGTFIKPGWPEKLYALTCAKIKPEGQDAEKHTGEKYRYMLGLIPSDRYYDPLLDPDFSGVGKWRVGEADIHAMTLEEVTLIAEKKGWVVNSVGFANTENNKKIVGSDYVTEYGTLKGFIKPASDGRKTVVVDGVNYAKLGFWWASLEMGPNKIDMVTKITNKDTGEVLNVPWVYTPTTYDHKITNKYTPYPKPKFELPVNITSECPIFISDMVPTVGLDMRIDLINNDPTNPLEYDFKRNGFNINTIVGLNVKPSGEVESDVGFGIQIRVYPKSIITDGNLYCRHYSTFEFKKEVIFDPNDFDISEFGFKPWEVNDWRVNELIFDRLLAKERFNGWYVESINHAKDQNGDYLTEGIRTAYQRGSSLYSIPAPPPEIISRTGNDGNVSLPSPYKKVYGVGAVPTVEGDLELKLEVVFSNTYLGEKIKKEIITHKVNVLPDVFGMSIDPELIIRKGEKVINYTTTGYPLTDEVADWTWNKDQGFFPGITAYTNADVVTNGDDKNFVFPEFTINRSNPGIGITLQSRYVHKKRTSNNSVAWYREYYTFSEFDSNSILNVYPPKFEDFNFKPKGVEWYKTATSCETFYFEKTDRYGWKVSAVELEIAGQPNESDYILRDFHGMERTTMYRPGSVVADKDADGRAVNSSTLMFTPKAVGDYQLNIKVTLTNPDAPNKPFVQLVPYSYNVQDQNVGIEISEERYFPLNIIVTTPYSIVNVPENDKTYGLYGTSVGLDDSISDYLKIDSAYNGGARIIAKALPPEGKRLYVIGTVLKRDPSHGQTSAPVFKDGTRVYYTEVEIPTDHLYDSDDMVIGDFDFQKDIEYPERLVNQVYTDRWTHLKEWRGWTVQDITYNEGIPDYHLYKFSHEGGSYTIPVLNNWSVSQSKDLTVLPPEGRLFMFSRFGFNEVGNHKWTMKVEFRGRYHFGRKYMLLEIENGCVVSDIYIDHIFENDQALIGETNKFTTNSKGLPPKDMNPWMAGSSTYFKLIGAEGSKITSSVQLRTVTLPSGYNGSSFMIVHGIAYTAYQSGLIPADHVRSETESRYIVTTDIIPADKIGLSKNVFNPTWFERDITQKTGSWIRFFTNFNTDGWEVQGVQPKGLHLDDVNEEQVMMKWNGEVIPQFYEEATNPNQFTVSGKTGAQRKSNTLIVPVKSGDGVEIDMEIRVKNVSTDSIWYVPFTYKGNISPEVPTYPAIRSANTEGLFFLHDDTLANVQMNGWTPPTQNVADTKKFLALRVLDDLKDDVNTKIIKTDFSQNTENASINFEKLIESDANFLLIAEYSPKSDNSLEGDINDGVRSTRFFGQTAVEKGKVADPDSTDTFIPVPDLVYETGQPYEGLTDRYLIAASSNGWNLKTVRFDSTVRSKCFTGFEGKSGIDAPRTSVYAIDGDTTKKYLYLSLTPLETGDVVYPVEITVENGKGETKTFIWNYTRKVLARTSSMTINDTKFKENTATSLPFNYINTPRSEFFSSVDVGGCIVESIDGLLEGESMSYRLYGRDMTVSLSGSRGRDARFYVRWSYYWTKGDRRSDNEIRNISYYSEIVIPKENILDGNYFDEKEFVAQPDLVYSESQPYEQQTDRFTLTKSSGNWEYKSAKFDPSVITDGLAFTKFDNGPELAVPTAFGKDNVTDSKKISLYLTVVPKTVGDITFPVLLTFVNKVSGEEKTIKYNYVKHVKERTSYIRLTLNEFQTGENNIVQLYHDKTPLSKYSLQLGPGDGMGNYTPDGGFISTAKSGESFKFNWSDQVTGKFNASRGEDISVYVRKVYYWPELDTVTGARYLRGQDNYLSNVVYFNRFDIPAKNVRTDYLSLMAEYFQLPMEDGDGNVDMHYLNEAHHYIKPAVTTMGIPWREDFEFDNHWTAKLIFESDIESKYPAMDTEYISPWIYYNEDEGNLHVRFSPKAKDGSTSYKDTIKYTLRISDEFNNYRYLPQEYRYEVADRGTKIESSISELVTGVKNALGLKLTNVPPFTGTGYKTSVGMQTPDEFKDFFGFGVDYANSDVELLSKYDFSENKKVYIILNATVTPTDESEGETHYFSRIPFTASAEEKKPEPMDPIYPDEPYDPTLTEGVNFAITDYKGSTGDGLSDDYRLNISSGEWKTIPKSVTDANGNTWTVDSVLSYKYNTEDLSYFISAQTPAVVNVRSGGIFFNYLVTSELTDTVNVVCRTYLKIKDQNGNFGKVLVKYVAKPTYGSIGSKEYWMDINVVPLITSSSSQERYTRIDVANPRPEGNNNGIPYFFLDPIKHSPASSFYYKIRFTDSGLRYYFSVQKFPSDVRVWNTDVLLLKAIPGEQFARYFYGKIYVYASEADIPDSRKGKPLFKNF